MRDVQQLFGFDIGSDIVTGPRERSRQQNGSHVPVAYCQVGSCNKDGVGDDHDEDNDDSNLRA